MREECEGGVCMREDCASMVTDMQSVVCVPSWHEHATLPCEWESPAVKYTCIHSVICDTQSAQAWKLLGNVHMCPSQCASMYTAPVYKGWPSSSSSVQAVAKQQLQCTRSVQVCTQDMHRLHWLGYMCTFFQAVSKLGHSTSTAVIASISSSPLHKGLTHRLGTSAWHSFLRSLSDPHSESMQHIRGEENK